jgi:hypothetical protein
VNKKKNFVCAVVLYYYVKRRRRKEEAYRLMIWREGHCKRSCQETATPFD